MRSLGAFLLIGALLFQTFPQSLLALDYHLHTDMYAMYCINKDKPEMQCNGMCQLDKKLDDLEHHHHDSDSQKVPVISVYTVPEVIIIKLEASLFKPGNDNNHYQPNLISKEFISKIPHPPKFSLS